MTAYLRTIIITRHLLVGCNILIKKTRNNRKVSLADSPFPLALLTTSDFKSYFSTLSHDEGRTLSDALIRI